MATTNFKRFDEALENLLTDLEYLNNSTRYNGAQSGIYPASLHNKFAYQASAMAAGLADMMVAKGYTVEDGTLGTAGHDHDALVAVLGNLITQYDLDQYDLLYPDASLADQVLVSSTRSVAEIENRYAGERFLLTFPRGTYVFKNDYATLATTSIQFQAGAKVQPWYSVRSSTYAWVNTTGSEYRCDLAAGGDPEIEEPYTVFANGVALTEGTAGTLTAGQYAYSSGRLFVRLSDSTDPDTKAAGYVTVGYDVILTQFFCPYFAQCFDVSGGGKIVIGNCESVTPDWWSDGTSVAPLYDTVAVQAAYDAIATSGGKLYMGNKDYRFNLVILNGNVHLEGSNRYHSVVGNPGWYPADETEPVITIGDGSTHHPDSVTLENFHIHAQSANSDYGLWVRTAHYVVCKKFAISGFSKWCLKVGDETGDTGSDVTCNQFREFQIRCGSNTDGDPTYGVYGARNPGYCGQTNNTFDGFMIWGPDDPNVGAAIFNPSDQQWSNGYVDVTGLNASSVIIAPSVPQEVPSLARFFAVSFETDESTISNIKNLYNDSNDYVFMTGMWYANGYYEKRNGTTYNLADRSGDCLGSMSPRFYDVGVSGNIHFHSGINNDTNETLNRYIRAESDIVGMVYSATLAAGGSGYSLGDVVEIVQSGGADAFIKILGIDGSGAVTSFAVVGGGTGYSVPIHTITISQSAGTATAVHNLNDAGLYSPSDQVWITGADQAGYNGLKTVATSGANSFTFTVASGTVSPATGTITSEKVCSTTYAGAGTGFKVYLTAVSDGTNIFYVVNTIGDIYLTPKNGDSVWVKNTDAFPVLVASNRGCPMMVEAVYGTNEYQPGLRVYRRAQDGSSSADGLATGIDFYGQDSTVDDELIGRLGITFDDVTSTTEDSTMYFLVKEGGSNKIPITITGNALGFYHNTVPVAQQTLATGTGATADNIITALQNLGLVKQS